MYHSLFLKQLSLGVVSILLVSHAIADNFYVGAGLGYSALNTPEGDAFTINADTVNTFYREDSSSTDIGGLGETLYLGYRINPTWAVELGYTHYAQSDYESQQTQYTQVQGYHQMTSSTSNASLCYSTHSYDLLLKGSMPVTEQVSLFAKAGISYVNQTVDYNNSGTDPTIPVNSGSFAEPTTGSDTYHAVRPAGGLGIHVGFNDWIATEIFIQGFLGDDDFSSNTEAIASAYIIGASFVLSFA